MTSAETSMRDEQSFAADQGDLLAFYIQGHFQERTVLVLHHAHEVPGTYLQSVLEEVGRRLDLDEQEVTENYAPYMFFIFPSDVDAMEMVEHIDPEQLKASVWSDGGIIHSNS